MCVANVTNTEKNVNRFRVINIIIIICIYVRIEKRINIFLKKCRNSSCDEIQTVYEILKPRNANLRS